MGRSQVQIFRRTPAAGQGKRTARSALDRGPGCVGRTVRFYHIRLLGQLLCSHGVRLGIWTAVNDFRGPAASPTQPLAAAITEGHKLTLHRDPAPGTDIVGGPSRAVEKHFQFGHRHRDTPTDQGEGSTQKQRCGTHGDQLSFHARPRSSSRCPSRSSPETGNATEQKEEAPFYTRHLLFAGRCNLP